MDSIDIHLAAERLGTVAGIPITNTLITSLVVTVLLAGIAIWMHRRLSIVPGKAQIFFETIIEQVFLYTEQILGSRQVALRYLPFLLTLFFFLLFANLMGLLPGVGSIGMHQVYQGTVELIPLLRPVATDLNVTLTLAILAFFVIEFAGVRALGFLNYFSRFVNVKSVIGFMVGIVEVFSELARLASLSSRPPEASLLLGVDPAYVVLGDDQKPVLQQIVDAFYFSSGLLLDA
jgi:F-type H+-transporting ATPase subunit a